jgi:hypothetical protein
LEWSRAYRDLAEQKGWDAKQKHNNLFLLLQDDIKDEYRALIGTQTITESSFNQAYKNLSQAFIPTDYRDILEEELYAMKKKKSESVTTFTHLYKKHLRYFPELPTSNVSITKRQQVYFYKNVMPLDWQNKYESSGQIFNSLLEMTPYFERLEMGENKRNRIKQTRENNTGKNNKKNSVLKNNNQQTKNGSQNTENKKKWCSFHKSKPHNTNDCKTLQNQNKHEKDEHKKLKVIGVAPKRSILSAMNLS